MADHRAAIGAIEFPESVLTYLAPGDRELALKRVERHKALWAYEFDTLMRWLPQPLDVVVDIGCGLAGVDLAFARANLAKNFVLIDGVGEPINKQHGYQEATRPWADVCQAQALFCHNAPDAGCIAFTPEHQAAMKSWPCDLVLSFKSCAFHYDVKMYLNFILASLRPRGRLIIDCRRGTDNEATIIDRGFEKIGLVESNGKRERFVFVKP